MRVDGAAMAADDAVPRAVTAVSRLPFGGLDEPRTERKIMNKLTKEPASPVFGLRYLEDREVEGLDVVGCLVINRDGVGTATGCDDADQIVP